MRGNESFAGAQGQGVGVQAGKPGKPGKPGKSQRASQQEEPRFKSQEEFEAFWDELSHEEGIPDGQGPLDAGGVAADKGASDGFERLMEVMNNKPSNREVLRRTLEMCRERCAVPDVEDAIRSYPEFVLVMQPPYRLIKFLIDGGGLRQIALDSEGNPLDEQQTRSLTSDQIDDLTDHFVLETTDVGRAVADHLKPMVRLRQTFAAFPDRAEIFCELLAFCKRPRSYPDIEALLTDEKIKPLKTYNYEPGVMMKPSVFVDNLESAGGLIWRDHAWNTTDEGVRVLEAYASQQ